MNSDGGGLATSVVGTPDIDCTGYGKASEVCIGVGLKKPDSPPDIITSDIAVR